MDAIKVTGRVFEREDSLRAMAQKYGVSHTVIARHRRPAPEPAFDKDGYPTEETLRTIREWKIASNWAVRDLMRYVKKAWTYSFPVRRGRDGRESWIDVATGGWSGNESIIASLKDNYIFWACCWVRSTRGGLYRFVVNPFAQPAKGQQG